MTQVKTHPTQDRLFLTRLEARCVIGIFDWERQKKQKVFVDLEIPCDARNASRTDCISDTVDYKKIAKTILAMIQKSKYFLIETLAEQIAGEVFRISAIRWIKVTVSKPGAVRFSENVGVCITRGRHECAGVKSMHRAFLSVGSNINPRAMIPRCVEALSREFDIRAVSNTYESTAVGPAKQPPFWNLVAEIRCAQDPAALKNKIKEIETRLGRKRGKNKFTPRNIDIDIAFYDDRRIQSKSLTIPHPDAHRSPYILLPLAELCPQYAHPRSGKTIIELLGAQLDKNHRFRKV